MQPQSDAMTDPALFSLPDIAVVRSAHAKRLLWTHHGQNRRPRSAHTQIETHHAVADRQGERLVNHDPTIRFSVLDREDGAGRQYADRKPRPVGDPQKLEIVSMRRRQVINRRIQHDPPLASALSYTRPSAESGKRVSAQPRLLPRIRT